MTDSEPATNDPLDPDGIYRQIGLSVVAFQSLENALFQICWLTTEPPHAPDGRRALAKLSFFQLVTHAAERVDALIERQGLELTEFRRTFIARFHALLDECRRLARHRNQIVHSA